MPQVTQRGHFLLQLLRGHPITGSRPVSSKPNPEVEKELRVNNNNKNCTTYLSSNAVFHDRTK